MNRVKMNAKHEYEFVANYKVMQNLFKSHKIDKVRSLLFLVFILSSFTHLYQPIPVEKLVKCKMQYVPSIARATPSR